MNTTKTENKNINILQGFDNLNLGVFIYNPSDYSLIYANEQFYKQYHLNQNNNNTSYIKSLINEGPMGIDHLGRHYTIQYTTQEDGTVLAISVDTTNEVVKESEINNLKWRCQLTGLPNNRKLMEDIAQLLDTRVLDQSLVILNVDFFSRINLNYGYEYGNEFIVEIGKFMSNFEDRVRLYSLNGAEFAFLAKSDIIEEVIFEIKERFNAPWPIRSLEQYTTISIGIVQISDTSESPARIVYKANHTVKESKSMGSNKVVYYKEGSIDSLIKNVQLEYYLRKSIMEKIDNFKVFYQPIIDAKTGKISGFEALSRWSDNELGFVLPSDYIGLAEYLGLIDVIDLHVLRSSTKFIKSLHDKGYHVNLSVNISAKQLYDDKLVDVIKETINDSNLPYTFVNIEITESSAVANVAEANKKIEELKSLGIGVHLDDFGSGYSSLNTLKDMPVTTVKIDRKFIKDMHKTVYGYVFIQSIISLAHSANLQVCCEGVETKFDYEELRTLDADLLQGFYFARPLPEDDVLGILGTTFE